MKKAKHVLFVILIVLIFSWTSRFQIESRYRKILVPYTIFNRSIKYDPLDTLIQNNASTINFSLQEPHRSFTQLESFKSITSVARPNHVDTIEQVSNQPIVSKSIQSKSQKSPFGICKQFGDFDSNLTLNAPKLVMPGNSLEAESEFSTSHWATVDFPPVPKFDINTHHPRNQDTYISGSVHRGAEPWDPYVWKLFLHVFQKADPGSLVLDIGANIGYFSLLAAAMGYQVVSVEPMSRNMAKFLTSIAKNGFEHKITAYHNALMSRPFGHVILKETHHTNQGNGQIRTASQARGTYGRDYVDVIALDDIVDQDVLLMKIDVESFEAAVLDGARHLLCNHLVKFITIEFSQETRSSSDCPARRLLAEFQVLGYSITDIVPNAPELNIDQMMTFPPNLLFTLKDTSEIPARRGVSICK